MPSLGANAVSPPSDKQAKTLAPVKVRANRTDAPPLTGVAVRVDRAEIERHNTVQIEDVLQFLPNLTIRKRYIGDRNAIIGGRAAGTTQSARSLVYADGLLLSDLLDSGYNNPPRWVIAVAAGAGCSASIVWRITANRCNTSARALAVMRQRQPW